MFHAFGAAILLGAFLNLFFSAVLYFGWDFHKHCQSYSPQTAHKALYEALICGRRIPAEQSLELKQMGVIHLFVVSGAHLKFLLFWLRKLLPTGRHGPLHALTLMYCFVCNGNAPIIRAWTHWQWKNLNRGQKLFFTPHTVLLLSVMSTLAFSPEEFTRLSLPLSWLACLGIMTSHHPFYQSLLIYIFCYPIIQSFMGLSIWSVIVTVFISPMVAFFLFPLSLLSFFLQPLIPLTDALWSIFNTICSFTAQHIPTMTASFSTPSAFSLWLYCLALHGSLTVVSRLRKTH